MKESTENGDSLASPRSLLKRKVDDYDQDAGMTESFQGIDNRVKALEDLGKHHEFDRVALANRVGLYDEVQGPAPIQRQVTRLFKRANVLDEKIALLDDNKLDAPLK
jgi:hypothetical protein